MDRHKTRKIIIGAAAVALILCGLAYIVINRGICIEHGGGFSFAGTFSIFEDIFPEHHSAYMRFNNRTRQVAIIPYLFGLDLLGKPPYAISIYIGDESQAMRRMVVESVCVDYGAGDKKEFKLNWDREFTPSRILRAGDGGINISIPTMMLDGTLPAVVEKNKSCSISLRGYFIDAAGNKVLFDTNNFVEYEPTYWRVYTYLGGL